MESSEDTPPAHLILILDLSPSQWQSSALTAPNGGMDLSTFMSQVLVFINSHLACRQENSVAILGAFPGRRYAFDSVCSKEEILTCERNQFDVVPVA
jgi:transcription initiation factor TFIIH subunit 3